MTVLYALGVLQTFLFNKRWSFGDRGPKGVALLRYSVAYASGYALNYAMLAVFVDVLRLRHEYVQGVTVLLVAIYLIVLLRIWVFRGSGLALETRSNVKGHFLRYCSSRIRDLGAQRGLYPRSDTNKPTFSASC
jgi:hypothetical protein